MKKGFTLIELITVIILLGLIALITYPAVNGVIQNSKEKSYKSQVDLIEDAARRWVASNIDLLPDDGETISLTVSDLIKAGFITNTNNGVLINPMDENTTMDGCVKISYDESYNQYTYKYRENC